MCCQKLQWKCKGCFVAAPGFSGGASVSLQCLTLHSSSLHTTTTTSVQESWLILVNSWSVSYTSLCNIYSFCQWQLAFFFLPPLSEKCAPVRTPESPTAGGDLTGLWCTVRWVSAYPVEKQPSSSEGLFSSPGPAATARNHSLSINTYVKINYPDFSFPMEKLEITCFLRRCHTTPKYLFRWRNSLCDVTQSKCEMINWTCLRCRGKEFCFREA